MAESEGLRNGLGCYAHAICPLGSYECELETTSCESCAIDIIRTILLLMIQPFMLGIMEDFATLCIFLTTCTRLKHLEIANTSMKRLDWVSAAAILSFAKCGNHLDAIIPTLTTLRLSLLPTHGTSFASLYDKLLPRLTELQDLKMEGYITTCGTLRGCLPTLLRSLTLQHCSHLSLRDFCDYLTCAEATPQLQSFIVRDAVLNSHFGDTWQLQQLAWGRGVQVSLGDNKQGW